jgi:hypothetical protein
MSIINNQVSVGTVATAITTSFSMEGHVHVRNIDNTDTVYLGGPGVTINNGYAILKGEDIDFRIPTGDIVYAVSGKSGHVISILNSRPNS